MTPDPTASRAEPSSYRDPAGSVFYDAGTVYRALGERGAADFDALEASEFFRTQSDAGRIVGTRRTSLERDGAALVLEHDRIPVVTYPYEWTFSMLKDAALLQLQLLAAALEEDLILKDSTPYNIQWRGASPTFIDIGSFERLREGEPWLGYRQFCELFLYPLMLRAHLGLGHQHWLRGSLEGITAAEMNSLLSGRHRFKPGVMLDVRLQARAHERLADAEIDARSKLKEAGFKKELIQGNVRRLTKIIHKLTWKDEPSEWSDYASDCGHVGDDRGSKSEMVRRVVDSHQPATVWDLGANDGHFSRIAAETADLVVALDADELTLDTAYRQFKADGSTNIQPLLADLANPSPAHGWRGRERTPLIDRSQPDLVLGLAVMHHVILGRNVPTREFLSWLAELEAPIVLEHVGWTDPMVKKLIANRRDEEIHQDYDRAMFRAIVDEMFDIRQEVQLPSDDRILLHLTPRKSSNSF